MTEAAPTQTQEPKKLGDDLVETLKEAAEHIRSASPEEVQEKLNAADLVRREQEMDEELG